MLAGITPTHAFFSVTPPEVDMLNTIQMPFLFVGQFVLPTQLVVMPLSSFNRLASEVGDPTTDVTLIHMTAR